MAKYKKISDNEFEIIETREESRTINLDFIESNIKHKEKLIDEIQIGIDKLKEEVKELKALKGELKKL